MALLIIDNARAAIDLDMVEHLDIKHHRVRLSSGTVLTLTAEDFAAVLAAKQGGNDGRF